MRKTGPRTKTTLTREQRAALDKPNTNNKQKQTKGGAAFYASESDSESDEPVVVRRRG